MKGDCSSSRALNSSEVIVKPEPRATGVPDFLLFWGEHATASAHRPRTRRRRMRQAPSEGGSEVADQEKSTERRRDQATDDPPLPPGDQAARAHRARSARSAFAAS